MVCWHLADVFYSEQLTYKKIYATIQKFGFSNIFYYVFDGSLWYLPRLHLFNLHLFISRRFYQKRLTIKEYNKWLHYKEANSYLIKNTVKSSHIVKYICFYFNTFLNVIILGDRKAEISAVIYCSLHFHMILQESFIYILYGGLKINRYKM